MTVSKTAPVAATKKTVSHSVSAKHTHNEYPIVLVSMNVRLGPRRIVRTEIPLLGGAKGDVQEHLKAQGYETFTASMGPISSNWDRACELYTYLVGGVVDYGAKFTPPDTATLAMAAVIPAFIRNGARRTRCI